MNAADLTFDEFAEALRRGAAGWLPQMAAVDLLIAHRHWLSRGPFLAAVDTWRPTGTLGAVGPAHACVDFDQLTDRIDTGHGLHDTGSERAVLALACSLAGATSVCLSDALLSLDQTNVRLIADAVLTAGGVR